MITGFYAATTAAGNCPNAVLIDNLTSFAPSLKRLQWTKSNNTATHSYREVKAVSGVDIYDFDGVLPSLDVSFSLSHVHLTPFGGAIELGDDFCRNSRQSLDSLFVEQAKYVARDLGMKLERSIYEKIVRTSIDTNRNFLLSGDVPNTASNTLVVLTPVSGEVCGLYSPAYGKYDSDRLIELEKLSGGALYSNLKGIAVFGAIFKAVLGVLLGNRRMYATVTNVDPTDKDFVKTFPEKMSEVLDECLVGESTFVLMSNRLKTAIGSKYTTQSSQNTLIRFDEKCNLSICGVPVVHSANIPSKVDWTKMPGTA